MLSSYLKWNWKRTKQPRKEATPEVTRDISDPYGNIEPNRKDLTDASNPNIRFSPGKAVLRTTPKALREENYRLGVRNTRKLSISTSKAQVVHFADSVSQNTNHALHATCQLGKKRRA